MRDRIAGAYLATERVTAKDAPEIERDSRRCQRGIERRARGAEQIFIGFLGALVVK